MSDTTPSTTGEQRATPGLFIVIGSVLIVFIGLMFQFQGISTAQVSQTSRSLWEWFWKVWNDDRFDVSHGPLIPLVTLFLVWWNRKKMAAEPMQVSWAGLGGVAFSLFLHWVGMRGAQPRLSVIALILLIWSLCWLFIGWRKSRFLIFPFSILLFAIPYNFLQQDVAFPLRILVTDTSVAIAKLVQIPVQKVGSQIFDASGRYQYDVAAACSGIRSLTTLLCIGAVFGYLTQKKLWKRSVLFLVAIPLAVLGNVVRVTLIIFAAHFFGQEAGKSVHDNFGLIIFIVVLFGLFGVGSLIDVNWAEWWKKRAESKKTAPREAA